MLPARFREKFYKAESGCWIWIGAKSREGYGFFHLPSPRRLVRAHRFAWENTLGHGPIPQGKQLDHLCRVPSCVNPDHLEVVTPRENTLRGKTAPAANILKTECPKSHPLTGSNLYTSPDGRRRCRECRRGKDQARRAHARAVPALRGDA
jgi:hypothetical protein